MSVSYKVIGRHIQEARKQAKLTQRGVAEKLNMSDTYYGKIERGECRVNLERLAQISVLLHTSLEDLHQRLHGAIWTGRHGKPEEARSCRPVFGNRIWLLRKEPQAHAARMQRHCTDGQRIKYS